MLNKLLSEVELVKVGDEYNAKLGHPIEIELTAKAINTSEEDDYNEERFISNPVNVKASKTAASNPNPNPNPNTVEIIKTLPLNNKNE